MKNLNLIIAGCIKSDQKCQKIIYEQYYGYALKSVFRYIYHYERAVDVVTDGYVKLFRNFTKFKCEDPENIEMVLMGWIRRIMINTAIDELRKNRMAPEIGGIPENLWQEPVRSDNADQLILYKDLVLITKKLPPVYRIVFNMFVVDGYTHHEIANALGISVGTSKSNLSKARVLLQKYIKQQEENKICSI